MFDAINKFFLKTKYFYEKYERYASSIAFISGFIIDNLTLRRVDLWIENIAILSYILLAGAIIFLFNVYEAGKFRVSVMRWFAPFLPFFLQVIFGGLFSAFFVFYMRSASFAASWLFIIFLATLLLGNEFFRKKYQLLTFQLSIYFIALFSYMIFITPVLLKSIGALVFLLGGALSLGLIFLFVKLLQLKIPEKIWQEQKTLYQIMGGIYLMFNLLYFTNIIPPIPLALTDAGVYHSLERTDGNYLAKFEEPPWYKFFQKTSSDFHWVPGTSVYSYSAIFAPTKLKTNIIHKWQYFDEKEEEWITKNKISYPIIGGRDGGYRGFTIKSGMLPGRWRVDVETERGQMLGRTKFHIIEVFKKPMLETRILR